MSQKDILVLPAPAGQGLQILASFYRHEGNIMLKLVLENQSPSPLHSFTLSFNTNRYGLVPATPQLNIGVNPQETKDISVLILPNRIVGGPPADSICVVLTHNFGRFTFQVPIFLFVLFTESGRLDKATYLRLWKEIPDSNEVNLDIPNTRYTNSNILALVHTLQSHNIFHVAARKLDAQDLLYMSMQMASGQLVVFEFRVSGNNIKLSTRTNSLELTPLINQSVAHLLNFVPPHPNPPPIALASAPSQQQPQPQPQPQLQPKVSVKAPPPSQQANDGKPWFTYAVVSPDGVLYEDKTIQVGFQSYFSDSYKDGGGGKGKLFLFYGNFTNSPITNLVVSLAPHNFIKLQMQPLPSNLAPKAQQRQQVDVTAISEFIDPPLIKIDYSVAGENFTKVLSLPIPPTKFVRAWPISETEFLQRWAEIKGPGLENQVIVDTFGNANPQYIVGVLSEGFHLAVVPGTSWAANNIVAAGMFSSESGPQVPCLVRFETSATTTLYRFTLKTRSNFLTTAFSNLLTVHFGVPTTLPPLPK